MADSLRGLKVARFLKLTRLIRFNRMLNKWQAMSAKKWQLNATRLTPASLSNAADVAAMLGCLLSAAPNLATVTLEVVMAVVGWLDVAAMVRPLRQAAHLHTLRLRHGWCYGGTGSQQQAATLEGVVRCLALPEGAGGEGAPCRALRRVLLRDTPPDALDACRRALARDGITVAVDTYHVDE